MDGDGESENGRIGLEWISIGVSPVIVIPVNRSVEKIAGPCNESIDNVITVIRYLIACYLNREWQIWWTVAKYFIVTIAAIQYG